MGNVESKGDPLIMIMTTHLHNADSMLYQILTNSRNLLKENEANMDTKSSEYNRKMHTWTIST
jgi:hypothetical protein